MMDSNGVRAAATVSLNKGSSSSIPLGGVDGEPWQIKETTAATTGKSVCVHYIKIGFCSMTCNLITLRIESCHLNDMKDIGKAHEATFCGLFGEIEGIKSFWFASYSFVEFRSIDEAWQAKEGLQGCLFCDPRIMFIMLDVSQQGRALKSPLLAVVNYFATQDFDRLTRHYGDAIGVDLVCFLTDSEEDFVAYVLILQYSDSKTRFGVAKCDDETTLLLVPSSDFLTKVLEVSGPERLYVGVFKFQLTLLFEIELHLPDLLLSPGFFEGISYFSYQGSLQYFHFIKVS